MIIHTMLVGHIVTATVISTDKDKFGNVSFKCAFMHHTETGSKNLCLDFGAKWNVSEGYEFTCNQSNIDRANKFLEQPPCDALGAWMDSHRIRNALAS